MMPLPRSLLLGILVFSIQWMSAVAYADDTFQVWYQSTIWWRLNQHWSLGSFADAHVDDGFGETYSWIASPRVRYDVNSHLQLQLNTSWLKSFNADHTTSSDIFRIEFEANPRLSLTEHFQLSMRDRFEWRSFGGGRLFNTRIRIRPQIDWIIANQGFFRGFFGSNEVFYDFDRERITENRLVPFGVIFRPAEALELRLYYLWRHTLGHEQWFDYHVAGISATLSF